MMEAGKTEVIKEQKLGKCGPGRYSDAPQRKQIRSAPIWPCARSAETRQLGYRVDIVSQQPLRT